MPKLTANTVVRRGFESVALLKGAEVPDWAKDQIGDHLVDEPIETVPDFPEGDPTERWTVPQLTAYAAAHGIDIGKAKLKPEVFAAVTGPAGDEGEADGEDEEEDQGGE